MRRRFAVLVALAAMLAACGGTTAPRTRAHAAGRARGRGDAQARRAGDGQGQPSKTDIDCFPEPHRCGYPDETNTGPEAGQSLTDATGTIVLTGDEHYEDKRLTGRITIAAAATGVVVKNDEIITLDACPGQPGSKELDSCTGFSVELEKGASGTIFSHDTIGGTEYRGPNTVQTCIEATFDTPYVAEYVKTLHCAGFHIDGGGILAHDYCPENYEIGEGATGQHYECVADDGAPGATAPLVIEDNTFLNPKPQTAAIFLQGYGAPIDEVRIEDNLLAGGDYTLYLGEEEGHEKLKGPVVVTGNRFARCLSKTCPDSHGYFREGGYYRLKAAYNPQLTTWSGNYWDDDLAAAR